MSLDPIPPGGSPRRADAVHSRTTVSPADSIRPFLFVLLLGVLLWSIRRASGRLAPRVAIAPLVFLVTRTPVLVAWLLGTIGWLVVLVPGALARGRDSVGDFAFMAGLSAFCGLGGAALVVGPVWAVVRVFSRPPLLPLEPGEEVLRTLPANHFVGGEARGGKLLVTTRRLGFQPHRFNVQLGTWSVRLEDVRGLACEGTRFLLVDTGSPGRQEWIVAPRPDVLAGVVRALGAAPEEERAAVYARVAAAAPSPADAPIDEVRGQF